MDISLRGEESIGDQPFLLWDTSRDQTGSSTAFDWKPAGPNENNNSMGLSAQNALHTAIALALFTWRRAKPYDVLPPGSDPKGWWGDYVDVQDGESEIGSRLWLLNRAPLSDETARLAVDYAYEALQTLVDQGVVSRLVCTAEVDKPQGYLGLTVQAFGREGQSVYDQKFERIWKQEFA